MKLHPAEVARRAEEAGNQVPAPRTRRMGLGTFLRRLAEQARKDHLGAYAGNLAYRGLFAIFPSLIALMWLLNLVGGDALIDRLLEISAVALPESAAGTLREQVLGAPSQHARGAITPGVIVSIGITVGTLASAFRAAMEALNAMYAVEESRPLLWRWLLALLMSLAVAGLLLGALALAVWGGVLAERASGAAGVGMLVRLLGTLALWPVLAVLVGSACALIYYFAPDVRQEFRWINTGTVVAVVLWLFFAALFSLYVNRFARPDEAYGALAGVAVLMVYVYASCFILLLGAEINQIVEIRDPAGKNEGERAPGDGGDPPQPDKRAAAEGTSAGSKAAW